MLLGLNYCVERSGILDQLQMEGILVGQEELSICEFPLDIQFSFKRETNKYVFHAVVVWSDLSAWVLWLLDVALTIVEFRPVWPRSYLSKKRIDFVLVMLEFANVLIFFMFLAASLHSATNNTLVDLPFFLSALLQSSLSFFVFWLACLVLQWICRSFSS